METTQTTTQTESTSTNEHGMFPRRSHRWFLLKLLLAFLILAVTFIAGVCWGSAFSHLRQMRGMEGGIGLRSSGMMMTRSIGGLEEQVRGGSIRGMFGRGDSQEKQGGENSMTSFFGSIVRVEGNKITIFNNASKEQVLMSQAETVILFQDRLTSVSQLAPGQLVGGIGSANADGSMNVKQLSILP